MALIGITPEEFNSLLPLFEIHYKQTRIEQNPQRKRKYGAGRKGGLPTGAEKLFFSLMYLKTYPTFDVISFLTNLDISNCCRHIQLLLPILETTLRRRLVLPKRQVRSVEEFLHAFPEIRDVFIDGTDRRIQKPVSQKRRKKLYSGKRKTTTRKNIVVSDDKKRILMLTPTKSGRRHDKRLFDKAVGGMNIPSSVTAWVDTGFQGLARDHLNTQIPKKKSRRRPLTETERDSNHFISSIRVVVEHAIAGIKRFRSTTDIYRNKLPNLDDHLMLLSAGLWNYHLDYSVGK